MGLKNVELHCINAVDQIAALPTFDCFISLIVLQHNPPPVIAFLLRTILRKLTPGGLAYFQVPTYQRGAVFKADEYLQERGGRWEYGDAQFAAGRRCGKSPMRMIVG